MNTKLLKTAVLHSVLVLAYVTLVVMGMTSVERMEPVEEAWAPVAFLMLFVLSAAIVGTLVFAKPVMMFLEGSKKEAVTLLCYMLGCLFVLTAIVLVTVLMV